MPDSTHPFLWNVASRIDRNETFSVVTVVRKQAAATKLLVQKAQVVQTDDQFSDIPVPIAEMAIEMAEKAVESQAETLLAEVGIAEVGPVTFAIEVIRPKPTLIVFGAGHVGHALATVGALTGYEVTVVDDREAFVSRDRFLDERIALVAAPFESAASSVQISSNTAVVIVTRGHQHDEICLRGTITSPARYLGMIGSKRRVIGVFKRLRSSGVEPSLLDRVHAPIGLDIGARSPQEIAVAIMAQIIQTFNSHLKKNWGGEG